MGLRSYERFFKVRQGFAFCIISSQQNIGWQGRERRSRVMRVVWTRGNRRRSRHFIHTPTFETDLYSAIVSVNHLFFYLFTAVAINSNFNAVFLLRLMTGRIAQNRVHITARKNGHGMRVYYASAASQSTCLLTPIIITNHRDQINKKRSCSLACSSFSPPLPLTKP